jgi:translation initiation factor 2 beta subunit (eIF-2beta)/eIF-5
MTKEAIVKEIIEGISNFKIIPFLGAGMSKPCKALAWGEIIDVLAKELNSSTKDYLLLAQEYEDRHGRKKLIQKLKELCELKQLDSVSLDNHMKLLAMNPPIIYTTNYDSAIEEASKLLLREYKTIVELKDIVESKHGEKQIIKFHGDFSDEKSIVFTRNDYDRRLNIDEHPLDVLFRAHLLGKSVLFLGYSFGDENIDYIFKKHRDLYGSDNLPKSYIISFESTHNEKKEEELRSKNVITLELSSVGELNEMIDKLNNEVFKVNRDSQFEDLFKPFPSVLLSSFELANLVQYVDSMSFTNKQKHDKIRETLEGKTIPQDIENDLHDFFAKILKGSYNLTIKEAMLISFQHTLFRKPENVVKLCFELMNLTEIPKFVRNFDNNFWGSDVIEIIERKLGEVFKNDGVKVRRYLCVIILGYLEGTMTEGKSLAINQVERLLDGLKHYRYKELGDLEEGGYTTLIVNHVIESYLSKFDSSLRERFNMQSFIEPQTFIELTEGIMKMLPKNFFP